ncbi:unnamed protein product [Meloidogyne enterolobii]|uniref:Uncharacterized protein n=1 Tax=Meloidogyne enterolobii TaxID=390850 RepID=A0ACB1AGC4_MELEN
MILLKYVARWRKESLWISNIFSIFCAYFITLIKFIYLLLYYYIYFLSNGEE